jgi:transposase
MSRPLVRLEQTLPGMDNVCIIFDNYRCYNAHKIGEVTAQHGVTFRLLSSYSPMLNLIEEVFGEIKANIQPDDGA